MVIMLRYSRISSYLSKISSSMYYRKQQYPIYITQPIHYASLEYELHYLLDKSSTIFYGEWYPLYFSHTVLVPPPLTKTLSKYEKRHRLQLLYNALSTTDSNYLYSMFFSLILLLLVIYIVIKLYLYRVTWFTMVLLYYLLFSVYKVVYKSIYTV
jgi:hypothetical protein